ncbi:plasmid mobilization relaxosome protein MobC [Streptomyces brasiliscabiei]|uniref:Plasmid mobilization relaxosome protein MobC n=1 Tax=Streptomyces brasiliscabiei TaxID=2736302 RepID=A0ABU8GDZ0_9ACTN
MAHALAQGCEGGPVGSRAGALGNQPELRHQGAPQKEGEAEERAADAVPSASDAALPERRPRRRAYQPTHREDVIAVRFTAEEKAEIIAAAARRRVYPAGFLATAGLTAARGSAAPLDTNDQLDAAIDELAALRAQISRVGNNINQIAYIYNAGGQPRPGQLDYALKALVHTLALVDTAAHDLVRKRV